MSAKWIPAHDNNFQAGRSGKAVNKVILHWIVGSLESADATFARPDRIASAHYGIGDMDVHQYVKEEDTAYHCGNLTTNRESIGIEHEGGPNLPITEKTIQTSIKLVADICRRYGIPADRDHIKKHSEIKATQCPGTLPIDRIVEEVARLLTPSDPLNWVKQMYLEQGIDLSRPEGEVRGRVQEIFDGWKKYVELEKRLQRAEKELAGARAEAADYETRLQTAEGIVKRVNEETADLRAAVASRDTQISSLTDRMKTLEAQLDPSKVIVVTRDEYAVLVAKDQIKAASRWQLFKAIISKTVRRG